MPIAGFVGLLGSGKTLGMTAFSKQKNDEGIKVFSNFHLTFGELINPIELIEFNLKNCVLCIDEAYTIIDSRFSNQASRLFGYFIKQSRKRDVWIYYSSQRFMDVDVRLRQVTNQIILCEKDEEQKIFTYTIIEAGRVIDLKTLSFRNAEQLYPLYDTNEVVMPFYLKDDFTTIDHLKELAYKCPSARSFTAVATSADLL